MTSVAAVPAAPACGDAPRLRQSDVRDARRCRPDSWPRGVRDDQAVRPLFPRLDAGPNRVRFRVVVAGPVGHRAGPGRQLVASAAAGRRAGDESGGRLVGDQQRFWPLPSIDGLVGGGVGMARRAGRRAERHARAPDPGLVAGRLCQPRSRPPVVHGGHHRVDPASGRARLLGHPVAGRHAGAGVWRRFGGPTGGQQLAGVRPLEQYRRLFSWPERRPGRGAAGRAPVDRFVTDPDREGTGCRRDRRRVGRAPRRQHALARVARLQARRHPRARHQHLLRTHAGPDPD